MTQKEFELELIDYIRLAITRNYMIAILITSSAEGKLPSMGFDYGAGKSTKGMWLLNHIYAGNWEKVKENMVAEPLGVKKILDRPYRTLGWCWDDMQLTVGKDKQHDPKIRQLAYYLTTVRPYFAVMIGTAPHRGMLQKDFRGFFHFEIIIPARGIYEVQQLKHWIDFKNPIRLKDRLRYRGDSIFPPLTPNMQTWYDQWRDTMNRRIRGQLEIFKEPEVHDKLTLSQLTPKQTLFVQRVHNNGFVRYETALRKGFSVDALRLKKAGWIEQDRKRRWILTVDAELALQGSQT